MLWYKVMSFNFLNQANTLLHCTRFLSSLASTQDLYFVLRAENTLSDANSEPYTSVRVHNNVRYFCTSRIQLVLIYTNLYRTLCIMFRRNERIYAVSVVKNTSRQQRRSYYCVMVKPYIMTELPEL